MAELYHAEQLPVLQNRTYASPEAAKASPVGRLRLVQDERSGLVRNAAFDPSLLTYDADYQNEQGLSAAFKAHLDQVERLIGQHIGRTRLLEVGCGKGHFIELLKGRGYEVVGVDPAYEGDSPDVIKAPFDAALGVRGDGVILRHVLEHMNEPLAFLRAIAEANGGGLIYIEVPCLDWILAHNAWFDLFYEHVNYFRLDDLRALFGRVVASGRVFGEQYLYVIADLATLREPAGLARLAPPGPAFTASLARAVALAQAHGGEIALWGGSSKGVIFSLFLQRAGVRVRAVVDINRAKQGRYLPVSAAPVISPEQAMAELPAGSPMLVMNSNYLDEIRAMTQGRFACQAVDRPEFLDHE
ncbi:MULTISPECIES: class I SAM-dependent methyltransferase [unclassified Pseudomonas]|uniref:class I SAM-dependent methyltransferase n=1 Tax=unclassified Pseudomonas TaxID=196821 RepID=UPI000BD998D3|nr:MULTISPECIES: class I SAM-dependent methyltransferase [unclassified Pseudomonas]PVZ13732.1 C-methyltransferase-like protein [Pseudomonas sp. URIL14HWK12:I12]PVZ24038.1 C-methyltransferase-like protein [Pseudomonas sp. URIL14HWK12:I10]PVZ33323.1 C-methyltransferase-like protein [Pseudomonas sp. URIL14HWK12:I11]SNZ11148.1 C-methyltransferase C-terminal domain-containing protein [Pseudomonas sp. URIL14HWK12:I9]